MVFAIYYGRMTMTTIMRIASVLTMTVISKTNDNNDNDHENYNEDKEYVGIGYDGKLSYDFNDLMALLAMTLTTTITKT